MLNRTQNLISKLSKRNWEYIKPRPIIHKGYPKIEAGLFKFNKQKI